MTEPFARFVLSNPSGGILVPLSEMEKERAKEVARDRDARDQFQSTLSEGKTQKEIDAIGTAIDAISEVIEREIEASPDQPRVFARAAETVDAMSQLISESLGGSRRPVGKLETLADLEGIESFEEFFSALFWEEIQSILRRELDPPLLEKFKIVAEIDSEFCMRQIGWKFVNREEFVREHQDSLCSVMGLTNLGWRHIMMLVPERNLASFRAAVDSVGPNVGTRNEIRLGDYGLLIASCDVSQFKYIQTRNARIHLIELFWKYEKLLESRPTLYIPRHPRDDRTNKKLDISDLSNRQLGDVDVRRSEEEGIGRKPTEEVSPSEDADPRWSPIDTFIRENPGEPIPYALKQQFARAAIASRALTATIVPPLPKRAPARWPRDRQGNENPAEFTTRVYRVWMDAEVLTRPILKQLDPRLFASLDNWLKNNRRRPKPAPLPEGFKLLTLEQANDAWVDRVQSGSTPMPKDPEELARLALALRYRAEAGSKSK